MSGYSKEKADKLIAQHEANAAKIQQEADDLNTSGGTHPGKNAEVAELERDAQRARDKAAAVKELKKHHGD
ncbi:hypothetical protein [Candidatus Chloroploca asiatica]|uniref:Uncharacterized protein n=1 Tax=Candidatus Chloroploca asiatica TaxID=1506545 RepID=A0A2H3KFQ7_9CHLR|nr:hypothetical protein [Candidatus Chloroploca asiatica]PDV96535.1 hypothetical protein A9Q02_20665 [Candidatus Chloroploca asiatica]